MTELKRDFIHLKSGTLGAKSRPYGPLTRADVVGMEEHHDLTEDVLCVLIPLAPLDPALVIGDR